MLKAFKEIGIKKTLKFGVLSPALILFDLLFYPQFRTFFLRVLGAKIGKNVFVGKLRFTNVYRTGFSGLSFGDDCFIGDYVTLDLAEKIILEEHVTIALGSTIITHRNVGYKDHPLQQEFPPSAKPVKIKRGSFIGASSTILEGVTIGEKVFIGACSLVKNDIPGNVLAAGVPAKVLKQFSFEDKQESPKSLR